MDAPPDELLSLLGLLPPQYSIYVAVAAECVFLASVLVAALKTYLGDPKPTDGVWKKRFFRLAGALDWLAVNTSKVRDKQAIAKLKRDVRTILPPPPPAMRTTIFHDEEK